MTGQVVLKETVIVNRRSQEDRTEGKDNSTCGDDKEQTGGSRLRLGYREHTASSSGTLRYPETTRPRLATPLA